MKLPISNFLIGLVAIFGYLFVSGLLNPVFAEMSPRDGIVRTPTGAPVPGITVVEYTDWCPRPDQVEQLMPGCPYPTNCHNERSTQTDENGRYYFEPMTPNPTSGCDLNRWWRYTCSNPEVFYKIMPPAGRSAQGLEIIPTAYAQTTGTTNTDTGPGLCPPVQHPTSNVPQSITTDLTCNVKLTCGKDCTTPADCDGAQDNCTSCLPNSDGTKKICRTVLQCNAPCSTDFDCAGASEGCNVCMPNNAGTAKTCQKPPACGQSCVRDDQCAGAKDGCTVCDKDEDTGQKICQEPFNPAACTCDGFDTVNLQYPSTNPFVFDSFAKVMGADMTKAQVTGMQFKMTESDKSNPNSAKIIAQSPLYTPEIVSSTAEKIRYKATWSVAPPQIQAGKSYRVFTEIKCVRKKKPVAEAPTDQYQSKVLGLIKSVNAQTTNGGLETAGDDLQLKTLNFVKQTQTDMCHTMTFEYNAGVSE